MYGSPQILSCPACGARFKLTVHRNLPVEGIPCARCGALIAVELPQESQGITPLSHREIFGFGEDESDDFRPQPPQDAPISFTENRPDDTSPHVVTLGEESMARLQTLEDPPSQELDVGNWFDDLVEDDVAAEITSDTSGPSGLSLSPGETSDDPSGLSLSLGETSDDPSGLSLSLPETSDDPSGLSLSLPETSDDPSGLSLSLPETSDDPSGLSLSLPETSDDPSGLSLSLPETSDETTTEITSDTSDPSGVGLSLRETSPEATTEITNDLELQPTHRPDSSGMVSSRTSRGIAFLVVCALVAAVYWWPKSTTIVQVVEADPPPASAIHLAILTSTRGQAITASIAKLRAISDEDLAKDVEAHIHKKNFGAAWDLIGELRSRNPANLHYATLEVDALIGAQDFHEARQASLRGLARFDDQWFSDALQRAIRLDPRLRPEVLDLPKDIDVDALRPLGGGRSISLKFQKNGQNVYAFKPAQKEWGDGWRSEVAAWRLCEVVVCVFEVPYSRSARITRVEFDRLYARQTERQLTYAERFDELNWVIEESADGPVEVLYGVLKEWVPGFVDWPIEYTQVWERWLSNQQSPELLQAPLKDAIQPLARYKDGEYVRNILRQHDGAPTYSVARQLSNILVFDFLTNNWDRFSVQEEFYGVNNQFAGGRFISLDNGAAFHLQSSTRVDARFAPVQRFSRAMVASIRNLDPTWANSILFPPIGLKDTESQRLDVFWKRRQHLLDRIDQLRDTYGDEQTLFFP